MLIETVHSPAIDDEAELRRKLYPDARVFELRPPEIPIGSAPIDPGAPSRR